MSREHQACKFCKCLFHTWQGVNDEIFSPYTFLLFVAYADIEEGSVSPQKDFSEFKESTGILDRLGGGMNTKSGGKYLDF
jgi:hypothetical protein